MKLLQCLFIFSLPFKVAFGEVIHLKVGESRKFSKQGALVIDRTRGTQFNESFNSFTVTALKPGKSSARAGNNQFIFYVLSREKEITHSLLSKKLKGHSRLKVSLENGDVLVSGKLIRFKDWESLSEACYNFNCDYKISTNSPVDVLKQFEVLLSQKFKKRGDKLPALLWDPVISTRLSSEKDSSLVRSLKEFGISFDIDKSSISTEPSVKIQMQVVEIKKEASLSFGIDWPTQLSASLVPSLSLSQNLEAILQGLERSGQSRTLASPTLLTRSGTQAEFLAGGELPIQTTGKYGTGVIWKKYGVSLRIKPQADSLGQLRVKIESEISRIDPSVSIDGVPGFLTHRTQNEFDLTKSKLIALSGLFSHEDSASTQGIPGFSRIPIFGSLFSSQNFRESKSELIIFVLPSIEGAENDK